MSPKYVATWMFPQVIYPLPLPQMYWYSGCVWNDSSWWNVNGGIAHIMISWFLFTNFLLVFHYLVTISAWSAYHSYVPEILPGYFVGTQSLVFCVLVFFCRLTVAFSSFSLVDLHCRTFLWNKYMFLFLLYCFYIQCNYYRKCISNIFPVKIIDFS